MDNPKIIQITIARSEFQEVLYALTDGGDVLRYTGNWDDPWEVYEQPNWDKIRSKLKSDK